MALVAVGDRGPGPPSNTQAFMALVAVGIEAQDRPPTPRHSWHWWQSGIGAAMDAVNAKVFWRTPGSLSLSLFKQKQKPGIAAAMDAMNAKVFSNTPTSLL